MTRANSTVSAGRLRSDIETLAGFGRAPEGGISRLAYSSGDAAARAWFVEQLRAAGLRPEVDAIGNIYGRPAGKARVFSGSHIDSVRDAGAYDGVLGSVCALEVARVLRAERPELAAEYGVVVFASEESVRFGMGCIGSRAGAGVLAAEDLDRLRDDLGLSLRDALSAAGLAPERVAECALGPGWCEAFLELHIDQGKDLVEAGLPIGVVTSIMGPVRYRLTVDGEAAHTGAARMAHRRDALAAAAEIILAVEEFSIRNEPEGILASVGTLGIHPGSVNTVAGQARLGLEVRTSREGQIRIVRQQLEERLAAIAARRQVTIGWEELSRTEPTALPETIIATLEAACRQREIPGQRMPSRPAHDAMFMARLAPVGMLLVRNRSGISHSPFEALDVDDIVMGAEVLLEAVVQLLERK